MANIIMAQGFAKFFINMAFSSIYVYSSELFPTVVRYQCDIVSHFLQIPLPLFYPPYPHLLLPSIPSPSENFTLIVSLQPSADLPLHSNRANDSKWPLPLTSNSINIALLAKSRFCSLFQEHRYGSLVRLGSDWIHVGALYCVAGMLLIFTP